MSARDKQASLPDSDPVPKRLDVWGSVKLKKWPVIRGAAVIGTALVQAVSPAHAQQAATGPFWQLSFTLEDRYDENVVRTDRARAVARGLTLGDARTTPAVLFTIERPLGRNMLSLNASAGYDFYRRNTQLNRERLSLGARASLNAQGCNLVLAPTFSRRQSDLGDLAILAVPGIDSVRNTETVQDYSAELSCGAQYGIRPLVTAGRSIGDNSNDFRRISDYRTWRYGGGLGYNSPTLGDFTARVTRSETKYPGRPTALGRSAFNTNRGELTGRRELGSLLTANGSISYISLDPQQGGTRRFRGLGWNLSLVAVPKPDLRVTGGLSRDVAPSLGTDALYVLNQGYSLGTTYALSRQLSVALSGDIARRRYVGATSLFGPALTNSTQRTVVATISASSSRRLGVSADLGYQKRNANGALYDYSNFFAALRTKFTL